MDRELALKNLAQTEAACAGGIRHIDDQQSRIERLRGDGHDVAEAERLLHAVEPTFRSFALRLGEGRDAYRQTRGPSVSPRLGRAAR